MDRIQRLNDLIEALNGGPGSGNFGHAGRPGLVGGSSTKGAGHATAKEKAERKQKQLEAKWKGNNIGAGGVPGDSLPDKVPVQKCPDPTAKAIFDKYAAVYNDPAKQKEAVDFLLKNSYKNGVFEVDAAKEALTERKTNDFTEINKLKENAKDALDALSNKKSLTPKQEAALDKYYKAVALSLIHI